MIKKITLLYNTVKHLKAVQIYYQIKYRLQKPKSLLAYDASFLMDNILFLSFKKLPPVQQTYLGNDEFIFLNVKEKFNSAIDWNFQKNGKLWNYNLQYANFLLQDDIPVEEKRRLILSLYQSIESGKLPLEPYPASLRIINVIRLYADVKIKDETAFSFLHAELDFLSQRPEYHLLGNHLLENAFALMMGGAFFSNHSWVQSGQKILEKQLNEQVLVDGAHFELSPMYHQIIFFRLLELIDWYASWGDKNKNIAIFLMEKAQMMRSWLENITFQNGDIPHFNDSAEGISYSSNWLNSYADCLGVHSINSPLGASGYRSIQRGGYECKIDCAAIGPDYQPGHAHADALSFILYYNQEPLFEECGTSTYQIGKIRNVERSTSAHNCVEVNGSNQSQMWSGFRVGNRAKVDLLADTVDELCATHDGYVKQGIIHKRAFLFKDEMIEIDDSLLGNDEQLQQFHLHFSPGLQVHQTGGQINISDKAIISFSEAEGIVISEYERANGYNKYLTGKKIIVSFRNHLKTTIKFV